MSLVLAVEPDAKQADALRRILGRHNDFELIVVTSAYAATAMMRKRVPDLLLLGASLGSKAQEIVDISSLVSDAPQTLKIPPLAPAASPPRRAGSPARAAGTAGTDPEMFAAQVAMGLARVAEQRARPASPVVTPEEPAADAKPEPEKPATTVDDTSQINDALEGRVVEAPAEG